MSEMLASVSTPYDSGGGNSPILMLSEAGKPASGDTVASSTNLAETRAVNKLTFKIRVHKFLPVRTL